MKKYKAIVLGAGPGGYVCAIRLAQLGVSTAIVEREWFGGVCLNVGCIPSKALIHAAQTFHTIQNEGPLLGIKIPSKLDIDFKKTQSWKDGVVKKLSQGILGLLKANKVDIFQGEGKIQDSTHITVIKKDSKEEVLLEFENLILATGARPIELDILKFDEKNILSSTGALALDEVPKSLGVIGGGFIGIEIGMAMRKLGSDVTIIEGLPKILASIDSDVVQVVMDQMKKLGIKVLTSHKVKGLIKKSPLTLEVTTDKGETQSMNFSHVLVAAGRKPNFEGLRLEAIGITIEKGYIVTNELGQTNIPHIYAIGDITGNPQLAHRASMDGLLVAETISGHPTYKDYRVIPWAVFSDPEIGVVGISETEAREKNMDIKIGKFPFAASGRALTTNEAQGFVKVIISSKDERILGVQIVGPSAANLIAEGALAIEMGACVEDVIRTIHTHPTLPETFPEALESALGKSIHIFAPKR